MHLLDDKVSPVKAECRGGLFAMRGGRAVESQLHAVNLCETIPGLNLFQALLFQAMDNDILWITSL